MCTYPNTYRVLALPAFAQQLLDADHARVWVHVEELWRHILSGDRISYTVLGKVGKNDRMLDTQR